MRFIRLTAIILCLPVLLAAGAQDLGKDFREAAGKGDLATVKELLAKGADIDTADDYGRTALFFALFRKQKDMVRFLIKQGADVNARDTLYHYSYPLMALFTGAAEALPSMLEAGSKDADLLLIFSANSGNADLLSRVLPSDYLTPRGLTCALVAATAKKHAEIAEKLRQAGAAPPAELDEVTVQRYAGIYRAEDGSELSFFAEGERLLFESTWELESLVALTQFDLTAMFNTEVVFRFRAGGDKVSGVIRKAHDGETYFARVEEVQP